MSEHFVIYKNVSDYFNNKEKGWFYKISRQLLSTDWTIDIQSYNHYRFVCTKDCDKHNLDGPAEIYCSAIKAGSRDYVADSYSYFIKGKKLSREQYWNHPLVMKNKLEMISEL